MSADRPCRTWHTCVYTLLKERDHMRPRPTPNEIWVIGSQMLAECVWRCSHLHSELSTCDRITLDNMWISSLEVWKCPEQFPSTRGDSSKSSQPVQDLTYSVYCHMRQRLILKWNSRQNATEAFFYLMSQTFVSKHNYNERSTFEIYPIFILGSNSFSMGVLRALLQ